MAKKATILIADDDRVFVTMLSDFLRKEGFNVMVAFDSMQALMRARQAAPSAVVLDVNMPGGTGIATLKQVRAMNTTANIPVFVVTASQDRKVADEARSLGANDVMFKPVELPTLLASLKTALEEA